MITLNLDAFDVLTVDGIDGQYRVSVKSHELPSVCPKCGSLRELYRY